MNTLITSQILETHDFLQSRFSDKSFRETMGITNEFWEEYLKTMEVIKCKARGEHEKQHQE